MITFNSIPLASVAPVRVDDIAVSSVRLTVQARQRSVRFGADYVRTTVCIFFIANESLSVLENFGLMGLPYPQFLKNMLDALKENSSSREK